jgi:hypothetical protein
MKKLIKLGLTIAGATALTFASVNMKTENKLYFSSTNFPQISV